MESEVRPLSDQLELPEAQSETPSIVEDTARDAERAVYLERLRDKLKDPEFRAIEGFPIGDEQAILALSDPPYYTVCPNPFIEDMIAKYGKPVTAQAGRVFSTCQNRRTQRQ